MFLQLLTTQLKNQNPLSPTDTNQLTWQQARWHQIRMQIVLTELTGEWISGGHP